ncbi:hypothetical protein KXD40_008792 [Peronospora effusa]|uniref:Uncharacterized protein n=1 Tax=Peronospora effusa TaxID=542832 RepID=A0A3M6VE95_9STRA|nr:hypothetical protein DD238_008485 [Peronospora effusa]RQM11667.1 hypothetical protein DD237_008518 [Peronospora effusa]UIZ21877.1 hypothetical protein KXD40_008792 [Peronospora effusa]
MWHVFGRASKLLLVLKQGLSVSARNVLISLANSRQDVRETFKTCLLHAIAVAMFMQSAPCIVYCPNIHPRKILHADHSLNPAIDTLGGGCHVEAGMNQ